MPRPRHLCWVIKLIKAGEMQQMERYKQHVVDQALTLLKAHDGIRCLFTTPKLLEAMSEKVSLAKLGITGVFCGGTDDAAVPPLRVRGNPGPTRCAPTYGNTLMGLAVHRPRRQRGRRLESPTTPRRRARDDGGGRPEIPRARRGLRRDGPRRPTTLTKEFFMPRFPERDEASAQTPCEAYPWDGVRNARPFSGFASSVVEGVY